MGSPLETWSSLALAIAPVYLMILVSVLLLIGFIAAGVVYHMLLIGYHKKRARRYMRRHSMRVISLRWRPEISLFINGERGTSGSEFIVRYVDKDGRPMVASLRCSMLHGVVILKQELAENTGGLWVDQSDREPVD